MAVLTFLEGIAPGEAHLREKWQSFGPWVVGKHRHSIFGWVKCLNGPSPLAVPTIEAVYQGLGKLVPWRYHTCTHPAPLVSHVEVHLRGTWTGMAQGT